MKKVIALLLAAVLLFTLCACGGNEEEKEQANVDVTESTTEEEKEESKEVKSIDFKTDKYSVKYLGMEKANSGLVDNPENVYIIKYEFENLINETKDAANAFVYEYYQNAVELNDSSSWNSKGGDQYELCSARFTKVMKGGKVVFAEIIKLTDDSPITVIVRERGKDDNYQMMIVDLKGALANKEDDKKDDGEKTTVEAEKEEEEVTEKKDKVKKIKKGDKIETEKFDFTLKNVELTYDVEPKDTSSFFTHYEAPDGKVYVHLTGDYYNKSKRDVCVRDLFTATADFDDGYTYDGFAIVDDAEGTGFEWVSSYIICTPLSTCSYHCLIECPEAVDESDKSLVVTFEIEDTTYQYTIR